VPCPGGAVVEWDGLVGVSWWGLVGTVGGGGGTVSRIAHHPRRRSRQPSTPLC